MNIILLISDTYRYDNLFDRASMPVKTPCLDEFSRRAVSIERFYTGSFPTIPHRTDVISGRFGWPWHGWQELRKSTQNSLPRMLADHGYVSQLICDCPHLFNAGFQKVFNAACALRGQEGDLYMLRTGHEIKEMMPWNKTRQCRHFGGHTLIDVHSWTNRDWKGEDDRFPPRTAATVVEFLEENQGDVPFFLWVDFFDPHEPWDPPEYMVKKYNPGYSGGPMLHPNYGRASDYTPEELKNLRAHYCAEAELVDRWVGRVLQKIDDLEMWDDTIVIFTSDHGTSLGEHNRTGKSNINDNDHNWWPIYPEVAQVPFMIAAPGLEGGKSIDMIAQAVDIIPTVADLAGLKIDTPEALHGISFAPQLRGEGGEIRDLAVCSTHIQHDGAAPLPEGVTPVLYTKEWAYVPFGEQGETELYRLSDDPYAEKNVGDSYPEVVKELRERLVSFLKEMKAPESLISLFDKG